MFLLSHPALGDQELKSPEIPFPISKGVLPQTATNPRVCVGRAKRGNEKTLKLKRILWLLEGSRKTLKKKRNIVALTGLKKNPEVKQDIVAPGRLKRNPEVKKGILWKAQEKP